MTREEFMFTLGYNGNQAIIDKTRYGKYKKASLEVLCQDGQFKAALCCAFWNKDEPGMQQVLSAYNRQNSKPLKSIEELKRAFGVLTLPETIRRKVYL